MAIPPLFPNRADCPLPYVPKLDFHFISDCQILPAPPPIFDCPDIIIPPEPPVPTVTVPPIPVPTICIPCPQIFASGTLGISCGSAGVVVTVTPLHSGSSCASDPSCGFLFDFQFTLPPPPCPTIQASGTLIYSEGAEPRFDVAVTAIEGSGSCPKSCDFVFDLTLVLPKPSLSLPSLSVSVPAVSVFAPCPEVTASATITQAGDTPMVTFTATQIGGGESGSCAIALDLDIIIPEFPSLSLPSIEIPSITIPEVPCPEVTTHATIGYGGTTPTIEFTATVLDTRKDPPSESSGAAEPSNDSGSGSGDGLNSQPSADCVIALDLNIQIPEPVCPVLLGSATIGYGPELAIDFNITPLPPAGPGQPCFYIFDLDIEIPKEASSSARCPDITATADTTSPYANVDVTVTKTEPCDYHFDFDFDFHFPSQNSQTQSCSCPAHGGFDEKTCQDFLWCYLPGGSLGWMPKGPGIGATVMPTFEGRMPGELVTICECPSSVSDSGSGSTSSLSLSDSSLSDSSVSGSSSESGSSKSSKSSSASSRASSSLSSHSASSSTSHKSSESSSPSSSLSSSAPSSRMSSSASSTPLSSVSSKSSGSSGSSSLSSLSSSSAFSSSSETSDLSSSLSVRMSSSSLSAESFGSMSSCSLICPGGVPRRWKIHVEGPNAWAGDYILDEFHATCGWVYHGGACGPNPQVDLAISKPFPGALILGIRLIEDITLAPPRGWAYSALVFTDDCIQEFPVTSDGNSGVPPSSCTDYNLLSVTAIPLP